MPEPISTSALIRLGLVGGRAAGFDPISAISDLFSSGGHHQTSLAGISLNTGVSELSPELQQYFGGVAQQGISVSRNRYLATALGSFADPVHSVLDKTRQRLIDFGFEDLADELGVLRGRIASPPAADPAGALARIQQALDATIKAEIYLNSVGRGLGVDPAKFSRDQQLGDFFKALPDLKTAPGSETLTPVNSQVIRQLQEQRQIGEVPQPGDPDFVGPLQPGQPPQLPIDKSRFPNLPINQLLKLFTPKQFTPEQFELPNFQGLDFDFFDDLAIKNVLGGGSNDFSFGGFGQPQQQQPQQQFTSGIPFSPTGGRLFSSKQKAPTGLAFLS